MNRVANDFVDEYFNIHYEDKEIGKGGQGKVFRTKDPDIAIKLVTDAAGNPITDAETLKTYSQRFKRVRLLPLPQQINISTPVATLRGQAGYVMNLLSQMVPLEHYWADGVSSSSISDDEIPSWLNQIPTNDAKKLVHYYKTGGLRRRLHLLYKCSALLSRLHGSGLVYGDLSPSNIFVSEDIEDYSVWLIDADNIRFEVDGGGGAVYTPKYGAPEIVQGLDGVRPSSDCYSFAIIAFYLLSLIHPFVGKAVDGTGDSDWADQALDEDDPVELAYSGGLPWVDDEQDDSNSSNSGLPRSLLLTETLKILFEETLGKGRSNPSLRPVIYHWPEVLAQAADRTIKCNNCSMSYYFDFISPDSNQHNCPYCGSARPPFIKIESYRWSSSGTPDTKACWLFVHEISEGCSIDIPERVLKEFSMTSSDNPELNLKFTRGAFHIHRTESSKIDVSVALDTPTPSKFQQIYNQLKIDLENSQTSLWFLAQTHEPVLLKLNVLRG